MSDAWLAFVNFFSPTISLGLLRFAVRKTPYMRAFTCYWGCILCCVRIIHSYIIRRRDSFVQMLWNNLSRDCRSATVSLVDYPMHIYYVIHNIHLCIRNYIANTTHVGSFLLPPHTAHWIWDYNTASLIYNILLSKKKKNPRESCASLVQKETVTRAR